MYFSWFSFSSASVYFHLFHPHNHHLSPNSPRLMLLFVKCATVNKVYLILSYLIKWKPLSRYWPLVRGNHRSPVDSPHKGQWRGALMFSWSAPEQTRANNRDVGDLRRHRAHYDVIVVRVQSGRCSSRCIECNEDNKPSRVSHVSILLVHNNKRS